MELLPIGSVVRLKDGVKPIMVAGYLPLEKDSKDKLIYDYCALLYPEGVIDSNQFIFFNHKQIEEILFEGLKTPDFEDFKTEIKFFSKIKEKEVVGAYVAEKANSSKIEYK